MMHQIVRELQRAADQPRPAEAVAEALGDLLRDPAAMRAIPPSSALGQDTWVAGPTLTVQRITWGPGVVSTIHEHGMWAVVGVLSGVELNVRFDVRGAEVVERERSTVSAGDVLVLRPDEAHAVVADGRGLTDTLHVYGGDILGRARREWVDDTARPFDATATVAAVGAYNHWMHEHGRVPTPTEGAAILRDAGYPAPALP